MITHAEQYLLRVIAEGLNHLMEHNGLYAGHITWALEALKQENVILRPDAARCRSDDGPHVLDRERGYCAKCGEPMAYTVEQIAKAFDTPVEDLKRYVRQRPSPD